MRKVLLRYQRCHSQLDGRRLRRDTVVSLLGVFLHIAYQTTYLRELGWSLESNHTRIMFYCWVHSNRQSCQIATKAMQYLFPLLQSCPDYPAPGELRQIVRSFIDNIFEGIVEEIPLVLKSGCHYLKDRMMDPYCSGDLVSSLLFVMITHPTLLTEDIIHSLYISVVTASNRQLCHEAPGGENVEQVYKDVLTVLM